LSTAEYIVSELRLISSTDSNPRCQLQSTSTLSSSSQVNFGLHQCRKG